MKILEIPVSKIDRDPDQPRKHFDPDSIKELADSIRENGLIQPIVVRPLGDRFIITVGERRWRAHKFAGLKKIRCIVSRIRGENALRNTQATENMSRAAMRVSEEAQHIDRQIKRGQTYEQLAKSLGKCRANIVATHQLLRLPKAILNDVDDGNLSLVTAKLIAKLPEQLHVEAYRRTAKKGVAEAKMILDAMELQHMQITTLGLTADETLAARRDKTLSALEQFKIASNAFLSGNIADIGQWINANNGLETIIAITDKLVSLVKHVSSKNYKQKVRDVSLMTPHQKAWLKIHSRKNDERASKAL
jgi:ParB family chromosome partitioning protein